MPPNYLSFLLRLWQVQSEGVWVWRFSLENPLTGERFGCKDLPSLNAQLEQICLEHNRSEENDRSKFS
jgi:hypothetical protein